MRRLVIAFVVAVMAGTAAADGPADETPQPPRDHEVLRERTSGFWTSNRPAENGAYRWRLLGIGLGLMAITGFVMVRLVRRANRTPRP
ncbi:MAG: hypothetical protein ABI867_33990 [Kofleriaceae bacterium]